MLQKYEDLKNNCLAVGSLPHKSTEEAINIVRQFYYDIPFCPQLPKLSKNEDMLLQYLENMPGIIINQNKAYFDKDMSNFSNEILKLNEAFTNKCNIDDYGLSDNFSKAFKGFIEIIKDTKPKYAKSQITGPYTLALSLKDKNGDIAYNNETYRTIITKTLSLKALWQIKQINKACKDTTPIIFIDEPTLSKTETIKDNEIAIDIIKQVSDTIQNNGAISAVHCCGDCNWSLLTKIGMDMINFDAFVFAEKMENYAKELNVFLENGGKIVWGIVPTLDKNALKETSTKEIEQKLNIAKSYLVKAGINPDLIDNNSLVSTSCGCGSLSVQLAEKAIKITRELSDKLKG